MKVRLTLTIDAILAQTIDQARGDISRSAYVEKLLYTLVRGGAERGCGEEEAGVSAGYA